MRSLYSNKVADSSDFTFAPTALKLIKKLNPSYVMFSIDTEPKSLWAQLLNLRGFWSYKGGDIDTNWPRTEGDGLNLFLKAHEERFLAFKRMVAGRLEYVDLPNHDKDFFCRDHFIGIVERLFEEILLIYQKNALLQLQENANSSLLVSNVHIVNVNNYACMEAPLQKQQTDENSLQNSSQNLPKEIIKEPHWRTQKEQASLRKLGPISLSIWKREILKNGKDPQKITNAMIVDLVKKHVKEKNMELEWKSDNLYLNAVKKTSPKIYDHKGNYLGLDPNFR